MSERNCVKEKEKFEDLGSLIKEYYCLVENNQEGLQPYATFKTYLIDDGKYNGYKCINRPKKIKELVDQLDDQEEDTKIDAILQLWATGGDIYVEGYKNSEGQKSDKLIHSISNKSRLQVCLKGSENKENINGKVINRTNLINFAEKIGKYIKSFKTVDDSLNEIPDTHNLKDNNFKDLLENNINSAINELLFWYYYENDKYPIINSRAKNSRKFLNKSFKDQEISSDIEFNNKCMDIENFNAIPKEDKQDEIYISKQLMLDQLFYSIDEMKSMNKVEDEYKNDENNEIYQFYKKLWNTIKEAKVNKELQEYYNEFCKLNYNKGWKENLPKVSDTLHKLQKTIKEQDSKVYDNINNKFKTNGEDFLSFYLFKMNNGIASIGNGFAADKDKETIRNILKENELLFNILTYKTIVEVNEIFNDIIFKNTNKYNVIKNRFLAVLFSDDMTTIANEANFNILIKDLKNKLGINLESETYIEQNKELMSFYLKCDDKEVSVYDKQIFYWWLYERLNDNLDLKKAIVYYGAPGTGKTYKAKKVAKEFMHTWSIKNGNAFGKNKNAYELQQFHPSFSYEDFIEGIRPVKDKDLELKDGVFKKFCKKKGEIEIALWNNKEFREKFKEKNDFSKIEVSEVLEMDNEEINTILKLDTKKEYKDLTLLDIIPPAFFIIDEINRADLSRVFGELMYSLEYRGYEGKIKTQYSYLVEKEDDKAVFFFEDGNYFFIPQNIYIIGTMNTIDRSVDSFDFALRRRFSWEEIAPDYKVIKEKLDPKIASHIANSLCNLNEKIKENSLLGSDYQIGHSYALNLENQGFRKPKDAKEFLWKNFIKPLLQEYFRGLGDCTSNIKTLKEEFDKNE